MDEKLQPFFADTVMDLYSVANRGVRVQTDTLRIQVQNLVIGTCLLAKGPGGSSPWDMYENAYNRLYQAKPEVSVQEFKDGVLTDWPKGIILGQATVSRISDQASLKAELKKVGLLLNSANRNSESPLYRALRNE